MLDDIDEGTMQAHHVSQVEKVTRFSLSRNLFIYGRKKENMRFAPREDNNNINYNQF